MAMGGHFVFDHLKSRPKILASLDYFGIKNILFKTLFFIKRSRLASIQNLDIFVWISNGPEIECLGLD
jgi:hypothetical protein